MSDPQADRPLKRRRSRSLLRRRWWVGYLVLLALSFGVQSCRSAQKTLPQNGSYSHLDSPEFTKSGELKPSGIDLIFTDTLLHSPRDVVPQDQSPGHGERPTLILLHGSPGNRHHFDRLIPLLADRFRVIAVDLPGFGDSSKWVASYSTYAHARYVLELMDQLEIDTAHVLGFSMGSGVAINLHDLAPQRLDSLIFYGGIGIQEGEGTGDYYFEHFKYLVGYGALVVLPEFIPHFGFLGERSFRHAFIRNFNDTDQRPMRGMLEAIDTHATPTLILHGRNDPLVPAWAAEQHHDIIQDSELVMFDRSHFMVFDDEGCRLLADEIIAFAQRFSNSDATPLRRTVIHPGAEAQPPSVLPVELNIPRGTNPWLSMGTIIGASYLLEDPTTIAVGLLVRDGQLDLFLAIFAIFVGIFTGDLALYLIGWVFGRRALQWKAVANRLPVQRIDALGHWFDTHGWAAVLASRFVPGTRLPLYVSAGALGKKPGRFALWTFLAVLIWAPLMLMIVITLGEAAASPFALLFGQSWLSLIAVVVIFLVAVRVALQLPTRRGRQKLWVKISRFWRWEFWPMGLFYAPLVPWLVWLGLRYRSATVWTLANPALPDGGVVGESKSQITAALCTPIDKHVLPAVLVADADDARRAMAKQAWQLPLILKPDAAQRGAGVRLIKQDQDLDRYFADSSGPALLQAYHSGPFEAGIFYYRMPGESQGKIFSITDKHFPVVTGDGVSTIEQLIWLHPRYRMQAGVFLQRFADEIDRVLAHGQTLRLAMAGNHCQGTLFADGAHLITPALEAAVDEVVQRVDGFYFGRLDARYADVEAFKRGEDLAVLELNGVTSESTNLYDPSWSLLRAYRTLFRQWALCFAIGEASRKHHQLAAPGLMGLLGRVRRYYKQVDVDQLAD